MCRPLLRVLLCNSNAFFWQVFASLGMHLSRDGSFRVVGLHRATKRLASIKAQAQASGVATSIVLVFCLFTCVLVSTFRSWNNAREAVESLSRWSQSTMKCFAPENTGAASFTDDCSLSGSPFRYRRVAVEEHPLDAPSLCSVMKRITASPDLKVSIPARVYHRFALRLTSCCIGCVVDCVGTRGL